MDKAADRISVSQMHLGKVRIVRSDDFNKANHTLLYISS